jgi:xanthine dehydrogenase molybdopterin-binding subunit B
VAHPLLFNRRPYSLHLLCPALPSCRQGAAASEVELDTLTGDWQLLRTDIVMDVGNPINPAIDIGQVEGGFLQGMGWLCLEELQWGDKQHAWVRPGHLFTKGPGTYKIPSANDIPVDFRVALLRDAPNVRAIHSSKVGAGGSRWMVGRVGGWVVGGRAVWGEGA